MKIAFAADHRGRPLKDYLIEIAKQAGHETLDVGTKDDVSCDYTDYGQQAVTMVTTGQADRAVLVCATGIGMSILANKVPGIRAALCWSVYMARLSRLHNDANVLVLSGDQTAPRYAAEMLKVWLQEEFEGGRHERRLNKIKELEKTYNK